MLRKQQEADLQCQAPISPSALRCGVSSLIFSQHSWSVSSLLPPPWWSHGTEPKSAALGWGNSQHLHPTAEEGVSHKASGSTSGVPKRQVWPCLREHWLDSTVPETSKKPMVDGERALGRSAKQSLSTEVSHFRCLPFVCLCGFSQFPQRQTWLKRVIPMGFPTFITPCQQYLQLFPSSDVFFTISIQYLNIPPASATQELILKANSCP